ncbi:MAG: G1 family glutamic endopeptidase [Acidimicrobiales bacterium]
MRRFLAPRQRTGAPVALAGAIAGSLCAAFAAQPALASAGIGGPGIGDPGIGAPPGAAPAACSTPFDALRAPPALLAGCGIATYPLQRVPELLSAGGGRTYSYDVAGSAVTDLVPPTSFDPLTAPAPERLRYGIPGPPAGAAGRAGWQRRMAKLHFVDPPPYLVELPAHSASSTPDYSDHWAGYVAYGGPFRKASSTWEEPSLGHSRCRSTSLTIWTGIGGYASDSLAQDGTAEDTPEIAQDQAWWELTPAGMVPVPLRASPGGQFTADVTYLGNGRFAFFMENDRTGAAWAAVEKSENGVSQNTAESIVERPCLSACTTTNAVYAHLSNFHQLVFSSSTVDGTAVGLFTNYQERMSVTGAPYGKGLAYPSPLSPNSDSFSVQQRSCS